MVKKSGFSNEQHEIYGFLLWMISRVLNNFFVAVANAYGRTSPPSKAAEKALEGVNNLRSVLDRSSKHYYVAEYNIHPDRMPKKIMPGTFASGKYGMVPQHRNTVRPR